MSAAFRAAVVVAVVSIATLGEGGASATSLLLQHLLLAAGVAIAALALPPSGHAPQRGPSIAWAVFVALTAAAAAAAPYAYAAWLVVVEIVAFSAMAWLAAGEPQATARALAPAIALLAAAHGVTAVAQKLAGGARPASTFLNPNHLAAWLAAAALFLAGRSMGRGLAPSARWAYVGAGLLALSGVFVTGSRGAVLGLAAGAAVLGAATFPELTPRTRRNALLAAIAVALAMGLGITARFRGSTDPYPFHRTRIWAASLRALSESRLLGTGPGQFATAAANLNFPLEEAPLRYARAFRTPHSDVLRAICEFGLPAGLAALAAVALTASGAFRRRRELTAVERGALAALTGIFAQACVDDLSTRPAITLTGAALAGLLLARPAGRPTGTASRAGTIALAILVVLTLGVGEIAGFAGFAAAANLPRGRLTDPQLVKLRRALAWNPLQPDGWLRLAEHFAGDGRSWTLTDYAAAREAAEHARRLQPADAFYARGEARVEASACLTLLPFEATRDRARTLYDEALGLSRLDASIPFEAARFLLQAGDPAGARRAAEIALRIEPRAASPRLCLARAILDGEGRAGAGRAKKLLDEAEASALRPGERPASSYEAALRSLDTAMVESIRRDLGD
jgi:O-antigen ligase